MRKLFKIDGFMPFLIVIFLNASIDLGHKITIQNILTKSFEPGGVLVALSAIVNLLILLPYIGLFSVSGFLNDKFSKTNIIRYAAISEIFLTLFIAISYIFGWFYIAFFVTLLLAIQSAIYSPAKYGLIKSIVKKENLGLANGVVESITIASILLSSLIFSFIFEYFSSSSKNPSELMACVWFIGVILFCFSVLETFCSYRVPFFKPSNKNLEFDFKKYFKFQYLKENLNYIYKDKNLLLAMIGLGFFWGISQLAIVVFPSHFKSVVGSDDVRVIWLILAVSTVGLIAGSIFAGLCSKNRIETGLIPLGAILILASLFIFGTSDSVWIMFFASVCFGFSGGIFIVPLNASIQYFTDEKHIGKTIAISNFIQNIFMVVYLFLTIFFTQIGLNSEAIFIVASLSIMICFFAGLKIMPHLFARLLIKPFFNIFYKLNLKGIENIPQTGGVLLVGNHFSWIDWLIVQICLKRSVKFVIHKSFYEIWYLKPFLKIFRVIPIGSRSSKSALEKMRLHLKNGEVVAIFPEGHISCNSNINKFHKGFEIALRLSGAKLIAFHIHGLWGSKFSKANKFYQKNSKKYFERRKIFINFSEPLNDDTTAVAAKSEIVKLSYFNWQEYLNLSKPFYCNWLDFAKSNLFKTAMINFDSTKINNLKSITAVILFLTKFKKYFTDEKNVGVLLPSSIACSLINLTLLIKAKVPVNLNYTLSLNSLEKCIKNSGMKTILSSKKFVEKLEKRGIKFSDEILSKVIYLEEFSTNFSKFDKIKSLLQALVLPKFIIKKLYFQKVSIDDDAVVLYSSGSEGEPKGIVLSHRNLLANIKQISRLVNSQKRETILASLPVFHSFGLTVTTYLPLSEGLISAHVADPTDALSVGKMVNDTKANIIFGTSTFFRLYTKRVANNMFNSIRLAIAGGEKLNLNVKKEFKQKFNIDILEGYGTTETSPVVSVNLPSYIDSDSSKEVKFTKDGSVGMLLAGTMIKICDPQTLNQLDVGENGLILIAGPQVMKGYYKKKIDPTILIDGIRYYKTGDIGYIDSDGFIFITDRMSRFAKIGGEMISISMVENEIQANLSEDDIIAATNLPDEKKGEKIVLLYAGDKTKDDITYAIMHSNLNAISRPSVIRIVDNIPVLGTGKIDFSAVKKLALNLENT
ncbi:MFS transporter [Campylobacter sp. FMV-PI01]|uniref:MFS transporter n=1 Tax=Campylobacter portucalensis TaxID=2608384 RepID=A0A6L5WGJ1_9BACT|nr:acyl-[ACP]--phospholipid O-acyltransferase [Campylobacter portucalensis]MSN96154.1 MFS transporter [Campylobacter portucalensis]